jgi:hypothetical protein
MNIWINQMSWGQKWVFSDISCWGQLGLHFCQHRLPANCQQGEAATPVAKLETHTLLSAAIGTVADVATFCARQPQTCEAMASVASVAEAKAKYSLKLAYEWANGQPIAAPVGDNGQSNGISGLLKQPDLQDRHAPQPSAGLAHRQPIRWSPAAHHAWPKPEPIPAPTPCGSTTSFLTGVGPNPHARANPTRQPTGLPGRKAHLPLSALRSFSLFQSLFLICRICVCSGSTP